MDLCLCLCLCWVGRVELEGECGFDEVDDAVDAMFLGLWIFWGECGMRAAQAGGRRGGGWWTWNGVSCGFMALLVACARHREGALVLVVWQRQVTCMEMGW